MCPKSGRLIARLESREGNPSSDAPPYSLPPVHLSESNDSKVPDGLGPEGSKGPHASESKDTVADSAGLISEHLPPSENKSDSETELPFEFPAKEGTSSEGNSDQSPLRPPAQINFSSLEETPPGVKQEPSEGQGNLNYDPNDEFDLRNNLLADQDDNFLSSSLSSATDNKTASKERSVITRRDVEVIRSHESAWQSENDALMAMRHLISKDSRPNLVIDKTALASVLFHSRPPADVFEEIVKAQAESFKLNKIDFENRMSKLQYLQTKRCDIKSINQIVTFK